MRANIELFCIVRSKKASRQPFSGKFAVHFDEVHSNFLSSLKNKYPVLSATDLKLCAYLRMNLSSKEIAQLMNISLKGVEVSRLRLRKKLQLSPEVNLFDFLIQSVS